jgi:hypothetical protein
MKNPLSTNSINWKCNSVFMKNSAFCVRISHANLIQVLFTFIKIVSMDSSVNIVIGLRVRLPGFEFQQSQDIFFFSLRPDRPLCLPSLLSNRYLLLLPWKYSNRNVMLTTHHDFIPTLRMYGAISPLPYTVYRRCHGKRV